MIFAQFTSSNDSFVMMLYNLCLYTPCMILVIAVRHLSFHFYFKLYSIQTANLKLLCIPTGTPHFLMKNNTLLCGKFYCYPHHQKGPGHMLTPPNESSETSVFFGTSSKSKEEIKTFQRKRVSK